MELLKLYLPSDLINIVDQYYLTLKPSTYFQHADWCQLFDYIGTVLTYLAVAQEEYTYTLYNFYDYFLTAWSILNKQIHRKQYQLFSLLVLYRVAPDLFENNKRRLPVMDLLLYMLYGKHVLSDVIAMFCLLKELPGPSDEFLFHRITSALGNQACLDSPLSIALFRSVFSTAPIRNYCHAESLLAWVLSLAQRFNVPITLRKEWGGMGANLRPRFNQVSLQVFYGIGPGLMLRLNAETIGELRLTQTRPLYVPYQLWNNLQAVFSK